MSDVATWDVWDLPPVDPRNDDPDEEFTPTPDGQVRCYFNGHLMFALESRFSIGFDHEPGEPMGVAFTAPIAMFPGEPAPEPELRTIASEAEIPIREVATTGMTTRVWKPAPDVSWDFEVRLERAPYGELS